MSSCNLWCSRHILGTGEAKHFKFGKPSDRGECWLMHDRLLPNGACSWSRDGLNFGK